MSRKEARECAYTLVFEYVSTKDGNTPTLDNILKTPTLTVKDSEYIKAVYNGVQANYDSILEIISRNTANRKLEKIFKSELAALMLAIYEMKYMDDIPLNVSISEAVELIKKYASTKESYSFVNGVLAGVYKELNK